MGFIMLEEIWGYILAIVVLQALSAFFSGSETAMTTASKPRLHAQAQEGNKRAKVALEVSEQKDKLLSTLLVGNNMVNTAAAAVATAMLTKVFGGDSGMGALVATVIITITLLIFSEVLPKTFAIHHGYAMSLIVSPILRVLMIIFAPLSMMVVVVVRFLLRCFGVQASSASGSTMEELKGIIDMHRAPDGTPNQERAMLRSILDLSEVEVRSVMAHRSRMETIDIDQPMAEIVDQALQIGHTRIPLYQGDSENIVGILNAKALLNELHRVGGDSSRIDMNRISAKPWFIPESTNLLEQLQSFRARREHFAVVVDEYGTLQGIVTLEDILEEIVGNIEDEHDQNLPGVIRQPGGAFLVDGGLTLRDLNRQYDWHLPEDEATTIAGLVLYEARRVPEIGQVFEFHGFRFEIVRRQRRQITQIRIHPPKAEKVD